MVGETVWCLGFCVADGNKGMDDEMTASILSQNTVSSSFVNPK